MHINDIQHFEIIKAYILANDYTKYETKQTSSC